MDQKLKNQLQKNYKEYSQSLLEYLFDNDTDRNKSKHTSPALTRSGGRSTLLRSSVVSRTRGTPYTMKTIGSLKTFEQVLNEVIEALLDERLYQIKDKLKKILKHYKSYISLANKKKSITYTQNERGLRLYDDKTSEELREKLNTEIDKIWPLLWFTPKRGNEYDEIDYGKEIQKYLSTDTKTLPLYNIDDIHLGARLRAVQNMKPPDKMKMFNDLAVYRSIICKNIYKKCRSDKEPNKMCFYYHGENVKELASAMIKYAIYLNLFKRRLSSSHKSSTK